MSIMPVTELRESGSIGTLHYFQVMLGFDGQKSVVASWMGQAGIRGMAVFPDGPT